MEGLLRVNQDALDVALDKMRKFGAQDAELAAFEFRFRQFVDGANHELDGSELEPVEDLARLEDLEADVNNDSALGEFVVIKLNGGLGTSMGLTGPKALIEVKPETSFLDVMARQVRSFRERHGVSTPLILMNSSNTRRLSLSALSEYALGIEGVPADFMQGIEPKLRVDNLYPVEWPKDPGLEWCPPGHGDIYASLASSCILRDLLRLGYRWCFISNSDNLGATPDRRILNWVARSRIPFAMEVVRGTKADRKGGHLARHHGRLILRESAQVPKSDKSFGDLSRWRYFNTNSIWVDLQALDRLQATNATAPELPVIVNRKTVDPSDPTSPSVVQLESAMGAAISTIDGAEAIEVPRSRFRPVKTTNDLLVVRSDAIQVLPDGTVMQNGSSDPPIVVLDDRYFKHLPDFDSRFPSGAPSLAACRRFEVEGDVRFGAYVKVRGSVRIKGPRLIPDNEVLSG